MTPSVEKLKLWLRIDSSDYDIVLSTLLAAAMANACNTANFDFNSLAEWPDDAETYVYAFAAHWFDNPEAAAEKELVPNPYLRSLLTPYMVLYDENT